MTKHNENQTSHLNDLTVPLMGLVSTKIFRDKGWHQHDKAQLLFVAQGVVEFYVHDRYFLVVQNQAIWIPAQTPHRGTSKPKVRYHSLYFTPSRVKTLPRQMCVLSVTRLLQALIERVETFTLPYQTNSAEWRCAQVIADEIQRATLAPMSLPLPHDTRCKKIIAQLEKPAHRRATLAELAPKVGATTRTLSRLFKEQTGLNFDQWRQHYLALQASLLLAQGNSTTYVAQTLGYANDSAFITMYKRITGTTPSKRQSPYRLIQH